MRFCLAPVVLLFAVAALADEREWVSLIAKGKGLDAFRNPAREFVLAGEVALDPKDARKLVPEKGEGVVCNSPPGRLRDLVTKDEYQDVEVHVEFNIGKGSNAGVKLMGLYEIQITDSAAKKELTGDDCGGIYPRAEEKPNYHHIDKGTAPKVNAAKKPGEWQTLDVTFKAPRFDGEGKKTSDAVFVKVVLNGQVIHEDVKVEYPTGAAWRLRKEVAKGPLLLQCDHGPVAWRNVKVRAR